MPRMMLDGLRAAALCALAWWGTGPAAAQDAPEPFVIGVVEDRSGAATFYSQETVKALKLAVDLVNRGETLFAGSVVGTAKGILGRPVKLIFEDDENNPTLTVVKARRLLENGAQMILMASGSASAIQVRIVCTEQKVFCFAPINVSGRVVEPPNNEFIFTVAPPSEMASKVYADAWKAAGYGTVALLTDNNTTSRAVGSAYQKAWEAAGLKTTAVETLEGGARDTAPQWLRVKESNPDVVLTLTQSASLTANILRTAPRVGVRSPRWGTNNLTATPKIWELAGPAINGLLVVDNVSPDNPNTAEVRKAFAAAYGADVPFVWIHPVTFDGMMLLKAAAERAGGTDGVKLRDAMRSLTGFPASFGRKGNTISFAPDKHNGAGPASLAIVEFANQTPSVLWSRFQPN